MERRYAVKGLEGGQQRDTRSLRSEPGHHEDGEGARGRRQVRADPKSIESIASGAVVQSPEPQRIEPEGFAVVGLFGDTRVTFAPKPDALGYLPDTFWAARPIFEQIRAYARSCVSSPDATLHIAMCRTGAAWPVSVRVDTGVKTPRPPILYIGVVGGSGAGKSTSLDSAEAFVPRQDDMPDMKPISTGQGICEAYQGVIEVEGPTGRPRMKKIQQHHNAFFVCGEGETIQRLDAAPDSLLCTVLRDMFSGVPIGQVNATEKNSRLVVDYSAGLVVNFVPEAASAVMRQAGLGTPQRFLWCWAYDPGAMEDAPPALVAKVPFCPSDLARHVTFCRAIRCIIRRQIVEQTAKRIHVAVLDEHGTYIRCRVAAILCVWDERMEVSEEDWRLAGIVWDTSCAVRAALLEELQDLREAEEREYIDARIRQAQQVKFATKDVGGLVAHHAKRIAAFVREHENEQLTDKKIKNQLFNGRTFGLAADAIAQAESKGWIARSEAGYWIGGTAEV